MFRSWIAVALAYLTFVTPALAHHKAEHVLPAHVRAGAHQVPEIDASAGLLALAGLATVLLFLWERSRRQRAK